MSLHPHKYWFALAQHPTFRHAQKPGEFLWSEPAFLTLTTMHWQPGNWPPKSSNILMFVCLHKLQHCLASSWYQANIKFSQDLATWLQTNIKISWGSANPWEVGIKDSNDKWSTYQQPTRSREKADSLSWAWECHRFRRAILRSLKQQKTSIRAWKWPSNQLV